MFVAIMQTILRPPILKPKVDQRMGQQKNMQNFGGNNNMGNMGMNNMNNLGATKIKKINSK